MESSKYTDQDRVPFAPHHSTLSTPSPRAWHLWFPCAEPPCPDSLPASPFTSLIPAQVFSGWKDVPRPSFIKSPTSPTMLCFMSVFILQVLSRHPCPLRHSPKQRTCSSITPVCPLPHPKECSMVFQGPSSGQHLAS